MRQKWENGAEASVDASNASDARERLMAQRGGDVQESRLRGGVDEGEGQDGRAGRSLCLILR